MKRAVCLSLLIFSFASVVYGQSESNRPAAKKIAARELEELIGKQSPITIIDVRLPKHYDASQTKIKGAIRMTPRELKWRLNEISREKQVVLYCACPNDATSLHLAAQLIEAGYKNVSVLEGGWEGWVQAGGPREPKEEPK
jgi:rhodanese-related sulfurtransferase